VAKKKKNNVFSSLSPQAALNTLIILAAVAAVIMLFVLMDKYIQTKVFTIGRGTAVELVDVPPWVNGPLKKKVYDAALTLGDDFNLDEHAAHNLQENIASQVAWLENPQVQITHNAFRVRGRWRKPLGLIKAGTDTSFYVDADSVVLDFVPVPRLPVVTIRGIRKPASAPEPGETLEQDDLTAALALLQRLDRMDSLVSPRRPLLFELDSIDVSNFNGRQSDKFPHIVFFARDNTQIVWGAELANWHRHLEASDEQKLAKLYSFYKEKGTLSGQVQTINLRDPQQVVQPIDKY
jgi:hypothetical protein